MFRKSLKQITAATLAVNILATSVPAAAQAPAAAPPAAAQPQLQPGAVVRRVVMKDAASAEQLRTKLEAMKSGGLFRDQLPGADPKKPIVFDIQFLVSGNYLLVMGTKEWVDANIETIRLMGYLFERPRAHLQLNLRVVQLTGPANADVIQMSETVRALVDAQRDEVVRTFGDLDDYLTERTKARQGADRALMDTVHELFPTLGTGERPLTVPEILLLLMLDRSSQAPRPAAGTGENASSSEFALLDLPRALAVLLSDPRVEDTKVTPQIQAELAAWKKTVVAIRDWCAQYEKELDQDKGNLAVFREALQNPNCPLPTWITRRLQRSMQMTERLYPSLVRKHTQESLAEIQRRFAAALTRSEVLEKAIAMGEEPPAEESKKSKDKAKGTPPAGRVGRNLIALKSLAEELVPAPLALFESVALAADNSAPTPEQLVTMLKEFSAERRKLDDQLAAEDPARQAGANYSRLQTLESSLNLWLRRVSEAMARALDQQFYRKYVKELRLLANKQLGKTSNRDILAEAGIDEVPDVARDLLLADTGVNIFVSNSISLQFAPDTTNSVSAQVQSALPSKLGMLERIQQADTANKTLASLTQAYGINGEAIVKALLAGGQAVPVQGGITLSATPSIGVDASSVSLSMTANQTLSPGNEKIADRVTNHSINNATVTALSYEPMVLSTLASNITYYEDGGGIPILRKVPGLKSLLKDVPIKPFKEEKRQKGVYQSSVIILEPVVIPTIEDLVRYHAGWRETGGNPRVKVQVNPD